MNGTYPSTDYSVSGLVGGDTVTSVEISSSGAAASAPVSGSPYVIVVTNASGSGLENYDVSYVAGQLTVSKAPLIITADNRTKPYGETLDLGNTAFSVVGLTNGETIYGVTLASDGTGAGALPGVYPITPSGALSEDESFTLANYDVTYSTNGTLTVLTAADLQVFLFGPSGVVTGSAMDYSLIVSNAGPSSATNVIVSNAVPAGLAFVSASAGGTFDSGVITWPRIGNLPAGGGTNFTFKLRASTPGLFTNIGYAISETTDPNPTNNNGQLSVSQAPTLVTAEPRLDYVIVGPNVANGQDGLYEASVIVTNTGGVTVAGARLYVTGLHSLKTNTHPVILWNAAGTNSSGVPYVQYNHTLEGGSSVRFLLEFYNQFRDAFTNGYAVEWLTNVPPPLTVPPNAVYVTNTSSVAIRQDTSLNRNGRKYLAIRTEIGKTYTVIYADLGPGNIMPNVAQPAFMWKVAQPSFKATASITSWYDDGPPKTDVPNETGRAYRVIQN